jgi:RNA polymerase sigma-70 factor (ECF subfamily)
MCQAHRILLQKRKEEIVKDDAGIVAQVLDGDVDAFEAIVTRYQGRVWALVASMAWSAGDTEDLVQQVFLGAYARLDVYEPDAPFWPWLKAITRNLVFDHLRSRARRSARIDEYREHLMKRLADRSGREEDARKGALAKCREEAGAHANELLHLRYECQMSFDEIGAKISKTAASAQRALSRVRLALRECIERRVEHDPA